MPNMGTTGTVNISKSMMESAVNAIEDYRTAVAGLNTELSGVVSGLIPSSFSGAAAQGFKDFYDDNVAVNVGENLTKMLDSLKEICETIKNQIPGEDQGVDDQLGQGNKNPGAQA